VPNRASPVNAASPQTMIHVVDGAMPLFAHTPPARGEPRHDCRECVLRTRYAACRYVEASAKCNKAPPPRAMLNLMRQRLLDARLLRVPRAAVLIVRDISTR